MQEIATPLYTCINHPTLIAKEDEVHPSLSLRLAEMIIHLGTNKNFSTIARAVAFGLITTVH
jgi:hypothetical protein